MTNTHAKSELRALPQELAVNVPKLRFGLISLCSGPLRVPPWGCLFDFETGTCYARLTRNSSVVTRIPRAAVLIGTPGGIDDCPSSCLSKSVSCLPSRCPVQQT